MTAAEKKEMGRMRDELGTRFCRRCDYCQPCQQGIPISAVMTFPSFVKRLPAENVLSSPFVAPGMAKAATCLECGECEARCPFGLPIRTMLKENLSIYNELMAAK
jgi:predicted aldo/keto reductase-like oxidoreductase